VLFTGLTTTFLKEFVFALWLTSPLLLSLALVITVLGQVVGKKEGWLPFDSFYWLRQRLLATEMSDRLKGRREFFPS
jgi:hypothetical protein